MEFTDKSLISIIVPVFNSEKYLTRCIKSILSQVNVNFEVILINDGSTDSSGSIANYFALKDDRVRVYHQTNKGVAESRNIGIDMSRGDLIGFVDSDDWIDKDMYKSLLLDMMTFETDISACDFIIVSDKRERDTDSINKDLAGPSVYVDKQSIVKFSLTTSLFLWRMLYKKYVFDKTRFPQNKIFEDLHSLYRIMENAKSISFNPVKKYFYNQRTESISHNVSMDGVLHSFEARRDMCAFISEKYPTLLYLAIPLLYASFVWLAGRICENEVFADIYSGVLDDAIDDVKKYPYIPCSLNKKDEHLAKLLLSSFKQRAMSLLLSKKKAHRL